MARHEPKLFFDVFFVMRFRTSPGTGLGEPLGALFQADDSRPEFPYFPQQLGFVPVQLPIFRAEFPAFLLFTGKGFSQFLALPAGACRGGRI